MMKLKKQYEDEYMSKCKVQADLLNLKKQYEEEISRLGHSVRIHGYTTIDVHKINLVRYAGK